MAGKCTGGACASRSLRAAAKHWDVYMTHFGAVGSKPPASLIGVSELAFPGLLIEIEATAVD